jgi:hypothetical protein
VGHTPAVKVTVTPAMAVALQVLAERSGLAPSTEARRLLNAALKQTMGTEEVKARLEASGHDPDRWHRVGSPYTPRRRFMQLPLPETEQATQ